MQIAGRVLSVIALVTTLHHAEKGSQRYNPSMKSPEIWLFVLLCVCTTFAKDGRVPTSVPDRAGISKESPAGTTTRREFIPLINSANRTLFQGCRIE
jgi:hypothetical protein